LDSKGDGHYQSADVVLCAANGIGTPRLLLASDCAQFPDGLANRSGLVGRRLMLHPLSIIYGYWPQPLGSVQAHNGSTVQCLEFGESDPSRGFLMGAKWSLHPSAGGPQAEALRLVAQGVAPSERHRRFAERFGHGLHWSVMCEDLPEESNRVVLSDTLTDSAGMPAPKLIYRYSANSLKNLEFNTARAVEIMREAGAEDVLAINPAGANAHLMGTARMGDDPASSVVDRWQMAHDIPNLGVLDGSVFVTSGPLNPTSTICALSLRAAEHLIEARREIPVPERRTHVAQGGRPWAEVAPPPPPPAPLTQAERARLAALADAILPAAEGMPAVADTGTAGKEVDRVLSTRPDLAGELRRVLSVPFEDAGARLAQLQGAEPEAWQTLIFVALGAYYLDPAVRARIGYAGQEARPFTPDRVPAYIDEGLLDHLLEDAV
jgi:hypothetical protein